MYGVFLGNRCHSRAGRTTDGTVRAFDRNDGAFKKKKNSLLFELYVYVLSYQSCLTFLSPSVFIITLYKQVIGGYCVNYGG